MCRACLATIPNGPAPPHEQAVRAMLVGLGSLIFCPIAAPWAAMQAGEALEDIEGDPFAAGHVQAYIGGSVALLSLGLAALWVWAFVRGLAT